MTDTPLPTPTATPSVPAPLARPKMCMQCNKCPPVKDGIDPDGKWRCYAHSMRPELVAKKKLASVYGQLAHTPKNQAKNPNGFTAGNKHGWAAKAHAEGESEESEVSSAPKSKTKLTETEVQELIGDLSSPDGRIQSRTKIAKSLLRGKIDPRVGAIVLQAIADCGKEEIEDDNGDTHITFSLAEKSKPKGKA